MMKHMTVKQVWQGYDGCFDMGSGKLNLKLKRTLWSLRGNENTLATNTMFRQHCLYYKASICVNH